MLKRMFFPSLSIYFFPIFSHFFPSPNPNFGEPWKKMGIFSIFKIETLFPSLFIGSRLTGPKMILPKNHPSLITKSETITY